MSNNTLLLHFNKPCLSTDDGEIKVEALCCLEKDYWTRGWEKKKRGLTIPHNRYVQEGGLYHSTDVCVQRIRLYIYRYMTSDLNTL